VLDFLRHLREESGAAVPFVHHTGHQGTHARGSSDLESYWESWLAIRRDEDGTQVEVGHREAEEPPACSFAAGFTCLLPGSYRGALRSRS
jgi:hypothetical protein